MTDYSKITALYSRLSVGDEDRDGGESMLEEIRAGNVAMRTMFLASSLMTASPVCRGGTRRSRRSWRRKSRRSVPRSTSRAASP